MALHGKDDAQSPFEDIYASTDLAQALPKYRMPDREHSPAVVYQVIHDELMLDGNSRQNLATFCQTWAEAEIRKLMDECLEKNMIDKDEYPQTAEIETRCVHMLADLWHAPDARAGMGCSTTGSSEAAMLGGLALKHRWREKRKGTATGPEKPNLICGAVQICWHKFARYFDVELREVPMGPDRYTLDPKEVLARVDENTIGVVPTLGLTFTLQYEPVAAICAALDEHQRKTGLDIPVHVDAASGGFIAPFIHEDVIWDFSLPRVKSINASGHKFGMAPLGVGWVVWREKADLPSDLIFWVNYLGGNMPTFALNFSRPGGQIIAQYYNLLRLGREGYRKIQQSCSDVGNYIANEVTKLGPFEVVYDGRGGVPGACWKIKEGSRLKYTLYDVADRLRERGWQVPAYSLPRDAQNTVVQRVLVRHGVSMDLASLLLDDLKVAITYLEKHGVTRPLSSAEGTSYHH